MITTTTKENAIKVIEHINSTFSEINVLSNECVKLMEKKTEDESYVYNGRTYNKTRTYYIHTDESEAYYEENITPLKKELLDRSVEGTDYVMEGITVHRWGSGNYNKIRTWKMVNGKRTKATRNELLKANEEEEEEKTTEVKNHYAQKIFETIYLGNCRVNVGDKIHCYVNSPKNVCEVYEILEKKIGSPNYRVFKVKDENGEVFVTSFRK